jgi:7-carboxy-7-deazaguanine synthase
MRVSEIYRGIQGEGPDSGVPMTFVRFQGCNQKCQWCDSKFTWDDYGTEWSEEVIVGEMSNYRSRRVYLTGGEPLFRPTIKDLVMMLVKSEYFVTIATNGTIPRPEWWGKVIWDVDFKCPSSGVYEFDWTWRTIGERNRIKFVVKDEDDLNFVLKMTPKFTGPLSPTMIVSPVIEKEVNQEWLQRVWNFCVGTGMRFSLQSHKVVFEISKRGV